MHLATEDYTLGGDAEDPPVEAFGGEARRLELDFGDDITPQRRRLEACMMNFKIMVDAHQDMGLEANDNTYSDTYQACNACNTLYTPIMNNLMNEALNELRAEPLRPTWFERPLGPVASRSAPLNPGTGSLGKEAAGKTIQKMEVDGRPVGLPAGAISMYNVADTQACQVVLPDNESYTCNDLVANVNQTFLEYEMDKLYSEFAAQGEIYKACGPEEISVLNLSLNERATVASNMGVDVDDVVDMMCLPRDTMKQFND